MRADSLENLTHYFEREGFAFYLSPACPLDLERLCDLVRLRARPALWLKETRRRKIMADGGCLVKLYTCNGLRDLTHSRRYASREVECYHDFLKAFGELPGVRLPQLYGYFARPFLGVLFRANGLVEEFVEGTRQTTVAELPLLPPLFAHLYRRAIYHPDMQFQNILWEEAEQRLVPIDYMGCNILEKPSWEALLMQLAWNASSAIFVMLSGICTKASDGQKANA